MEIIKFLVGFAWLFSLFFLAGEIVGNLISYEEREPSLGTLTSLALGYITLGTLSIIVAGFGLFNPTYFLLLSVILFGSLYRAPVRQKAIAQIKSTGQFLLDEWNLSPVLIRIAVGSFCGLICVESLAPCSHQDAFSLYLNFPKFQALSGRLWSDYPLNGNFCMWHSNIIAAFGFLTNDALHLSNFVNVFPRFLTGLLPTMMVFVLVMHLSKRLFDSRSHFLPAFLVLSIDAVMTMAFDGKTFMLSLFFEVFFLWLWIGAYKENSLKGYLASYAVLSFGLSTLPQVFFHLPLQIILAGLAMERAHSQQTFSIYCGFKWAISCAAVVLFYPTIYQGVISLVASKDFDFRFIPTVDSVLSLARSQTFFHGFFGFWELLFKYSHYKEIIPATGQNFGPLALIASVFSSFVWISKRSWLYRGLFTYFCLYFLEFFFFKQTTRHVLFAFVGLVLPFAHLWEVFLSHPNPKWLRPLFQGTFAFILAGMFLRNFQHSVWRQHFQYLFSQESTQCFIARVHPTLYPFLPNGKLESYLKENLKENENFMIFGRIPYLLYFSKLPIQFLVRPSGSLESYLDQNKVSAVVISSDKDPLLETVFGGTVLEDAKLRSDTTVPVGPYRVLLLKPK